mgnify:CR=1 FL=1
MPQHRPMTAKPSTKKKTTHGGARPGAGRPRRGKEPRVLFFQTTVATSTKTAALDVNVGEPGVCGMIGTEAIV